MTVLSLDPVANFRPSGENLQYQTSSQWSDKIWKIQKISPYSLMSNRLLRYCVKWLPLLWHRQRTMILGYLNRLAREVLSRAHVVHSQIGRVENGWSHGPIMVEAAFGLKLGRLRQECEQAAWWQHDGSRQVGLQSFHQLVTRMRLPTLSTCTFPVLSGLSHSGNVLWIRVHEIARQLVSASLIVLQRGKFGL